jgi:hypothetical protein
VKIIEAIRQNDRESRKELLLWLFERAAFRNSNNKKYQFWQQNNQPIELNTNDKLDKYLNYVHNNPVEAGFVLSPEDYLYSSAMNYAGRPETLIDVLLM